ncbi:MAG: hypothetical protein EA359_09510 [Balneolaceae bacterium]|nr:MAG: hypothetical protein EA359_09510 [Balneolaceae bacterium]
MEKTILRKASSLILAIVMICFSSVHAQNQVEDAIKQMSEGNVTGYLQPFLNGFGANLNSGFSGSAKIEDGFTIRIDAVGMASLIGESQETFNALPPAPYPQQRVSSATIFGDQGATVQGPEGLSYKFQNGQLNMDYFPLAVPQITIGNFYNTQLVFRFFALSTDSDVPDINMIGLGLRHGLNQYFNDLPVDLAAGLFYQSFKIGEIMNTSSFAVNGMASKEFGVLTIYGGAQYEHVNMNLNYTFSGAAEEEDSEIDISFTSENFARAYLGLNLNLKFVHLRTDINVGKVIAASATIGFGI